MSTSLAGFGGIRPGQKVAGYNVAQIPNLDPQSMQYRQSLLEGSQGGLRNGLDILSQQAGGDESYFKGTEDRAFRDFEKGLGRIGSRYAGVGSGAMSSRRSSAFSNEVSGAAGDLASRLQEQRMGIQRSALEDLIGLSQMLLSNKPYDFQLTEPKQKKKWWQTAVGAGAPIAGAAIGGAFGGIPGAQVGSTVGSSFGSGFH